MRMKRFSLAAAAVGLTLSMAACSSGSVSAGGEGMTIVAPAAAGGGWDQTARAIGDVIEKDKLADDVQVENQEGQGGITGLTNLKDADPDTLLVTGAVMVGSTLTLDSDVTLSDVTPIARLTEEQEVVVVPKDSPYQTIDDLVAAIKKDGHRVTVAGGSKGGLDHILAGMILKAEGVDTGQLKYVAYDGGGDTVAALLGNKVSAGISGAGEYRDLVKSGDVRALATSGDEEVLGYEGVKTLTDLGVDVNITNWRGVVAPPSLSAEEKKTLTDLVDSVHSSAAWQEVLETNGWVDAYMTADEFGTFIGTETASVTTTLTDIGLIK